VSLCSGCLFDRASSSSHNEISHARRINTKSGKEDRISNPGKKRFLAKVSKVTIFPDHTRYSIFHKDTQYDMQI